MLFRAYVDDSTEDVKRIFTIGGFNGTDDTWIDLEPVWLDFLTGLSLKGISYFHATDCFAGANEFEGLFSSEREQILDGVLSLIITHKLILIGHGVDENAYRQYSPKPKRNEFGTNRYVAAFAGAIQAACESANPRYAIDGKAENICDFYVENSEYKLTAAEAVQKIKKDFILWYHQVVGNDTYGDKKGKHAIPLLQIADFGAFLANKHLTKAPDGRIPWGKYYDALSKARLVWPIVKYSDNCLKILHDVHIHRDDWSA